MGNFFLKFIYYHLCGGHVPSLNESTSSFIQSIALIPENKFSFIWKFVRLLFFFFRWEIIFLFLFWVVAFDIFCPFIEVKLIIRTLTSIFWIVRSLYAFKMSIVLISLGLKARCIGFMVSFWIFWAHEGFHFIHSWVGLFEIWSLFFPFFYFFYEIYLIFC